MMDWPVEPLKTTRGHQHTNNQSQGTAWGPLICLSAVRGTKPGTGELDDDVLAQARQCFRNLGDLLEAVDSGLDRVLRVGMYMKDLRTDRPQVNKAWREVFGDAGPARFAVEVADIGAPDDNSRLLLDVFAVRGEPTS
jgi:2-iminobutanoate/2-iminopropanoate deaminase